MKKSKAEKIIVAICIIFVIWVFSSCIDCMSYNLSGGTSKPWNLFALILEVSK